jgi:hypothetical protein
MNIIHIDKAKAAAVSFTNFTPDDGSQLSPIHVFFFLGATAPIWALAYLHETLRFTPVF